MAISQGLLNIQNVFGKRIPSTCALSVLRSDRKYKCIFMLPKINSTQQLLICVWHYSCPVTRTGGACPWFVPEESFRRPLPHPSSQWTLQGSVVDDDGYWCLQRVIQKFIPIFNLCPSDSIGRHWSRSTLAQVPDGTKPLPEPMLTYHQRVHWQSSEGIFTRYISHQLLKSDWKLFI